MLIHLIHEIHKIIFYLEKFLKDEVVPFFWIKLSRFIFSLSSEGSYGGVT